MTETISYREIVKLIHPDYNPNIIDAGDKIRDAKLWRKDESILYRLGVQWGVITPNKDVKYHDTSNSTYTPPLSAVEDARKKHQELKIKKYQDLVKAFQQAEKEKEEQKARDKYKWRVKNRIFEEGDVVYVRTRKQNFVVSRQTSSRVYFFIDGVERFSLKKNVRHSR